MQFRKTIFAAIVSTAAILVASSDALAAAWTTPSGTTATFRYENGRDTQGRFGSPVQVTSTGFVFEPENFIAVSSNDTPSIVTDTMKVIVSSLNGDKTINFVSLNELGDYSINNGGGVKAHAGVFVRVEDPSYPFANRTYSATLNSNPSMPINAEDADGIWSGNLRVNLPAPAARISITFNNTLHANSDVGGSSFIQKKLIGDADSTGAGLIIGTNTVPEPTAMLAILGGAGFIAARRRKA